MVLWRLREVRVLFVADFRLHTFIFKCTISLFHRKTVPRFSLRAVRVGFVGGGGDLFPNGGFSECVGFPLSISLHQRQYSFIHVVSFEKLAASFNYTLKNSKLYADLKKRTLSMNQKDPTIV